MSDDNLEPLITQCPNCETRFRVTETQLQVAAGRVRCGACLTVFEGTAHLILDGEAIAPDADGEDVDAVLEELEEVGDRGKATAMPDIAAEDLAVVGEAEIGADDEAVPDALAELEAQFLAELKRDVTDQPPELDKEALDDETAIIPEPLGVNVAEPIAEPDAEVTGSGNARVEPVDGLTDPGSEDPAGLHELDEVSGELPGDQSPLEEESDIDDAMVNDPSAWLENMTDEVWAEGASAPSEALNDEDTQDPDDAVDETEEVETIAQVEPEPATPDYSAELEMTEPERRRSWLTLAISLLLLIGLPLQVLWFQYDTWVKDPELRPIYGSICNIVNCELPPMRDVSLISSKRSFIRAHPDRADARIVDVLMVNNANFAQPYPLIELTATSMRGQLIAGRRFKPTEYLQGEASDAELMPPRTPVHVSLEIQDPGEEAMNFEVKFR